MGITDPSEEYFKGGLWCWATSAWKKVIGSAAGLLHVQIAGQEADVEVKQQAAADLTPGVMGWVAGAWQKLPMLWGFSSQYQEQQDGIDVAAGNRTLTFSTVPAGEIWVVQGWTAWTKQANAQRLEFYVNAAGSNRRVSLVSLAVAYTSKSADVPIVLEEDDNVFVVFNSCVLNDDIYSAAWGYKMLIAQ